MSKLNKNEKQEKYNKKINIYYYFNIISLIDEFFIYF